MTFLDDLATYLHNSGYGTVGTDIFFNEFHDSPNNQLVIFTNGGHAPSEVMGGAPVDYPGIDIQVRNTSKATAMEKAEALRQLLDASSIGDLTLFCDQSFPVYLGKDDSSRYRFVVVLSTIIERL